MSSSRRSPLTGLSDALTYVRHSSVPPNNRDMSRALSPPAPSTSTSLSLDTVVVANTSSTSSSSQPAPLFRSRVATKRKSRLSRTRRTAVFCTCFSPTVSDSSDEDEIRTSELPQNRRRSTFSSEDRPWSIASLSDHLRMRLAIAGEASHQHDGSSTRTAEPPVHRIVELSHHLVKDIDRIFAAPYYWGKMDRFQAEELLDGKEEGTFLLRDSAQDDFLFSVSFRRYQRTLHARIEQASHSFGFDIRDPQVFSSNQVTKLIDNYKDPSRCLFFEPQLSQPLQRPAVFSLQELCRARILASTSYNRIGELPLPAQIMPFLRQYHYAVPVRVTELKH